MTDKLIELLKRFIETANKKSLCCAHVQWIFDEDMQVYLRSQRNCLEQTIPSYVKKPDYTHFLCIASVEVAEKERGKGLFIEFLSFCERSCPWDGILIENVLSDQFQKFFVKRSYHRYGDLLPPSYYWLKGNNNESSTC